MKTDIFMYKKIDEFWEKHSGLCLVQIKKNPDFSKYKNELWKILLSSICHSRCE